MLFLGRYCREHAKWRPRINLDSLRSRSDEANPKSDFECAKICALKSSTHRHRPLNHCSRGDIKIGIIGGGMAPIYASLLLKQSKLIKRINVIDPTDELTGAVHDSSHIDTRTKIKYYGKSCVEEGLVDVDIIALMDEKDFDMGKVGPFAQFTASSRYVAKMSSRMVRSCPSALVAVFARPVTATLPMVSEVYKFHDWWDPNRIIGSCAIDAMRIESMTACLFDLNPSYLTVPIVGGADPCTVVPLLTRAKPVDQFSPEHEATLIRELRSADKELASTVSGYKGPSLSTGAAAAKFLTRLSNALNGRPNVICSAYVRSDVLPICRFFSNELLFSPKGVEKNYGLPRVSSLAIDLIEQSVTHLNELSEMAVNIVRDDNVAKLNV